MFHVNLCVHRLGNSTIDDVHVDDVDDMMMLCSNNDWFHLPIRRYLASLVSCFYKFRHKVKIYSSFLLQNLCTVIICMSRAWHLPLHFEWLLEFFWSLNCSQMGENGNAKIAFFHPAHLSLNVLELFLHLIKSAATTMQTISRCFHYVHITYERQLISIRGWIFRARYS